MVLSFSFCNAFKIIPSFKTSKLLVGSSNKIHSAWLRNALASEILCHSPPDNDDPSSLTGV